MMLATEHKIAKYFYLMLKCKTDYIDWGEDYYEKKYKKRVETNLRKQAKTLGFELVKTIDYNLVH